jgi:hypothetical protein
VYLLVVNKVVLSWNMGIISTKQLLGPAVYGVCIPCIIMDMERGNMQLHLISHMIPIASGVYAVGTGHFFPNSKLARA